MDLPYVEDQDDFFGACGVQRRVFSCGLVSSCDQSHRCCVICKLKDCVAEMGGSSVRGVERERERVEQQAQPLENLCSVSMWRIGSTIWGRCVRKSLIQEVVVWGSLESDHLLTRMSDAEL